MPIERDMPLGLPINVYLFGRRDEERCSRCSRSQLKGGRFCAPPAHDSGLSDLMLYSNELEVDTYRFMIVYIVA